MANRRPLIMGIPIDNLTMDEFVENIIESVQSHATGDPAKYVATVNVDFLRNTFGWNPGSVRDKALLRVLRQADFVTPDGMPIVWLSRWLGVPLKERVSGADLVYHIAEAASDKELSIFFLGGQGSLGERTAEVLKKRYPNFKVAGIENPYIDLAMPDSQLSPLVESINRSKADILLISLGNPKQELWFGRVQDQLKVPVSIGIGGSYDFIVGTKKRAPKWMQRYGLEWTYRLFQEPGRLWRRYVGDLFHFGYLSLTLLGYLAVKRARMFLWGEEKETPSLKGRNIGVIGVDALADHSSMKEMPSDVALQINLQGIHHLGSDRLSHLADLCKTLRKSGRSYACVNMSARCRRELLFHRYHDQVTSE